MQSWTTTEPGKINCRPMTTTWPLAVKPYAVQVKALEKSCGKRGYAFFMEMGLGKTAVVLAAYLSLRSAGLVDRMLVICPNSLKNTWMQEAIKMGAKVDMIVWPN